MPIDLKEVEIRYNRASQALHIFQRDGAIVSCILDVPWLMDEIERLRAELAIHVPDLHAYPQDEPGPGDSAG